MKYFIAISLDKNFVFSGTMINVELSKLRVLNYIEVSNSVYVQPLS